MEGVRDIVAGTAAGIGGLLVGHPLDVLRVRSQTTWAARGGALWQNALAMLRNEGARSVYKGVVPPMLGVGVQHALYFGVYEAALRTLSPTAREGDASLGQVACAAAVGGVACSVVTSPVEMLKVRQQVNERRNERLHRLAWRTLRRDGARGLYRGWLATVARDVPGYVGFFAIYEGVRRFCARRWQCAVDDVPAWANFLAGGLGGALSWLPVYPIDVIKSRVQAHAAEQGSAPLRIRECARQLRRESGGGYGVRAFYRGLGLTVVRAFPVDASILLLFSQSVRLWDYFLPPRAARGAPTTPAAEK